MTKKTQTPDLTITHSRAMKNMSQIGSGKVFGYEAETIPSWEDALTELDRNARVY